MLVIDLFFFAKYSYFLQVSVGDIPSSKVTMLIQPFAMCVATQRDQKIVGHTIKHIFDALLYQSDLGRTYTEKLEAWKSVSFDSSFRSFRTMYNILYSIDGIPRLYNR